MARSGPGALGKVAARVRLLRRLVERFALYRERLGLVHQIVQLFAPLQHGLDRVAQYDLRLVQILLHAGERVRFPRVLILAERGRQRAELYRGLARRHRPLFRSDLRGEIVQHLGEQRVADALRVLVVRYQHRGQIVRPHVHVAHVHVLLDRLPGGGLRSLDERLAGEAAKRNGRQWEG